jgi:hypothetical protein
MGAVFWVLIALLIGTLTYQTYVTVRVARFDGYEWQQKVGQLLLIWLAPFFGALLAHFVLHTTLARPEQPDTKFTRDEGSAV